MADYIREIGGNTRLMIREGPLSSQFQFFMQTSAGNWNYQQQWSWGLRQEEPGHPGNWFNTQRLTFRLERGGGWQFMGWIEDMGDLTGSTVHLRLTVYNSGLGFPTYDFFQDIFKARTPDPPKMPRFDNITETSVHVWFEDNYDGGSPILQAQMGGAGAPIGHYPDPPGWKEGRDRVYSGLYPGVEYLFFGRVRNAIGWSKAGAFGYVRTLRVPDPPSPVAFADIQQTNVKTGYDYNGRWDGGTPVREWQMGYGLDPNYPQLYRTGVMEHITGLLPGRLYYFWARGRNDIGWSVWSARSEVLLLAGAYVRDADIWRRAVPYVKVDGIWRIAKPWTRAIGTWKETRS